MNLLQWLLRLFGKAPRPNRSPRPPAPPAPRPGPSVPVSPSGPIRVTTDDDGQILNRGYSYWPQACVLGEDILCFAGHADGRPRFFLVNRRTGSVARIASSIPYTGTGEGWYFDRAGWVYLPDGPRLRRVNPLTGEDQILFTISGRFPECRLWQAHSTDDGLKHSATVERIVPDGPYERLGTIVAHPGGQDFYKAGGVLDESQITPDGSFLVIKEDDDNRIIDRLYDKERRITNADGALGHSDCGPGFMVGEDDQRGACVYLDLVTLERRVLFETWGMGVVSVRGDRCLVSDQTLLQLVALDGSGRTPVIAHGMTGDGYDHAVRANLSPDGSVAAYISNTSGRMDLYLVNL